MQLRPHQIAKSKELAQIVKHYNIGYLQGEVRSGKTLTALNTAQLLNLDKVLVITKKKAISSIRDDFDTFGFSYDLNIINYESVHRLTGFGFDLIIYDECHSLSAFPKPSKRTRLCKKLFFKTPCILMTGTSAVESYSQYYHQFFVSAYSPFRRYSTFYKWAVKYVTKKEMKLPTHTVIDYSDANVKDIDRVINPYMVKMSQKDARFVTKIKEHYLEVETPKYISDTANKLLKDRALQGTSGFVLGDTPAKLQSKVHQIVNGHVIVEQADGETKPVIFSHYKAEFIKHKFQDKKIAILYYYQSELEILKKTFDNLTTDLEEFNNTYYNIAIQQNSTEGMNLSKADALVYFNLGYSGKNFIQSRDRMTVKDRTSNDIYFICESFGMTKKILSKVRKKENFNSQQFMKDFGK